MKKEIHIYNLSSLAKKCQGGGSFTYCVPLLNQARAFPKWTVPAACVSKNCSDHESSMLLWIPPYGLCPGIKRNKRALQVCTSFIEGYNEPLMQQDSLGGSDVPCPFWWAHKLVATSAARRSFPGGTTPASRRQQPQAKESEGAAQQSSAGISLPLLLTAGNSILGNKPKASQA